MTELSTGYIEVDLLPRDVDSPDHPEVKKFRRILQEIADEYDCSITYFDVHEGTVTFSVDDDAVMAEIIRILEEK
ncbi:MAG: hypothetical protein JRF59_04405 [Deltaproteobacteria bacterium]|nr:hypothetical protein [Deltaproteobacteria bacterium]MBW1922188.1 hypothetical protein [Deltaproteobacteria bacterium]MBW1950236.1 hypothetical protein [Deltaproteobacteria bacterium]MBW2347069.1 hypothetical protein [Deltaproteobacteria bacterium]